MTATKFGNQYQSLTTDVILMECHLRLLNTYILLDVLLCSIAEYFYELCRILASP